MLAEQSRLRDRLSPRNVFRAASLISILAIFIYFRAAGGKDYFGFNSLYSAWAGATSFCVVWSLLTFVHVYVERSMAMRVLSDTWIWLAILALCVGVFLGVRLAVEVSQI
jgi:hypothetical protein